jgi:acetoacetyl-CoA synthetase
MRSTTGLGRYLTWLEEERGLHFDDYDELWRWSVDDVGTFWKTVWDHFDVRSSTEPDRALGRATMPGAEWFAGASLNYAEHALRKAGPEAAVIARSQTRGPVELSWDELRDQVARCRRGLASLGVGPGDRVVGYVPNTPEPLVAMLASASLGALWASCPPEFGTRSVIDRFGQLDPAVLIAVGGYRYGSRQFDRGAEVARIREQLPTLRAVVEVPYAGPEIPSALKWQDLLAVPGPLTFERVPFDHPLYVLFSSGTTGPPKPIVHGHGGILLEHLKALVLHQDLGPTDRFFWFSTTGWMMWNLLVSGLLAGTPIVLFDGDPGAPDLSCLWQLADETGVTVFGVSAPFLMSCRKAGLKPRPSKIRSVGSTGAPLAAEGFRWVYEHFPGVWLTSISGGTDVCTAFVGGSPWRPVVAGEISCRYLGAKVEAFDEAGHPVVGSQGELVLTAPLPSMPVRFWGDADGSKYRGAYFDRYPGVWDHGDWVTITDRGTCIITGRSDATLNRGGVRLGTSEFYSVVEAVPGVVDSIVVHLEDGHIVLLVQLAGDVELDERMRSLITSELRTQLSPRHAPDEIHAVATIPRTHSGKKLEVPVKRILDGAAADSVISPGALQDPSAATIIEAIARARRAPAATDRPT